MVVDQWPPPNAKQYSAPSQHLMFQIIGAMAESSKPQEILPGRCGSFALRSRITQRRRSKL